MSFILRKVKLRKKVRRERAYRVLKKVLYAHIVSTGTAFPKELAIPALQGFASFFSLPTSGEKAELYEDGTLLVEAHLDPENPWVRVEPSTVNYVASTLPLKHPGKAIRNVE